MEELSFKAGSIIWICLFIFMLLKKIDFSYYVLVFTSVLTTVAFIDIRGDSILVFQIVFFIIVLKYAFHFFKFHTPFFVGRILPAFIGWCIITIPFSMFHGKLIVSNINSRWDYVRFNYQQITQTLYLLIGFATCIITNSLLTAKKICYKKVNIMFSYAYMFSLFLAILQQVIPVDIVNRYFRNSANVSYFTEGSRISGTFNEPSMLALYCAPLFAGYLYQAFRKVSMKYFCLAGLFIIVTLKNYSSSGAIGLISAIIMLMIVNALTVRSSSRKRILLIFLFVTIVLVVAVFNTDQLKYVWDVLADKMRGNGISGSDRLNRFKYHMHLGVTNLLPTGYGTVRSYDLLSTWFCELGIIGLLLYFGFLGRMCIHLLRINTDESIQLLFCVCVHNIIMFVSVSEIMFLSVWIYYGMGFYLMKNHSASEDKERKLTDDLKKRKQIVIRGIRI